MANDFYSVDGSPATGSSGSSAVIRSEFTRLQASFDKMPSLTSTGGRLVRVNPGSTALEAMTLTAGAILYGGGNNEVVQGNNLVWNASNNTLAINGNVSMTGCLNTNGPLIAAGAFTGSGASATVIDLSGTSSRLISYGNSAANRGAVQLFVSGAGGANAILALAIDANGNTTLNNLNATQVGVTNLNATGTARAVLLRAGNQIADGGIPLEIGKDSQFPSEGTGAIYVRSGTGAGNVGLLLGTDKTNNTAYIQSVEPSTSYGTKTLFLNPNGGTVRVGTLNVNGAASFGNLNATEVGVTNLNATTRVIGATIIGTAAGPSGSSTIQVGLDDGLQHSIRVFGNSAANKGPLISLFRAGGTEGFIAQSNGGNIALGTTSGLADYNDATINTATSLQVGNGKILTPQIDSGFGTLTLKGAGTTAVTFTNANTNLAGTLTGTSAMLSPLNNSLAADVTLNNTSLFFDGPSVAQGNVGTWFASGSVAVILSPAFTGEIFAKLWDGTTVMASGIYVPDVTGVGNRYQSISLSGFITAPTGNIRISVKDVQNNNSVMTGNITQQGKDSTITAIRIG